MADGCINLNCANCGARLEIHDDMERFACGHCGTQMVVQRRGGTVALRAVTEAIQKVQMGTDKTAAELALVRFEKELRIARTRQEYLVSTHDRGVGNIIALCTVTFLIGLGLLFSTADASYVGAALMAAGLVGFGFGWRRKLPEELGGLRAEVQSTERKIEEARAVVDS
jgi:DNA-directed RNA polymerase subunit RPC12/RpoP